MIKGAIESDLRRLLNGVETKKRTCAENNQPIHRKYKENKLAISIKYAENRPAVCSIEENYGEIHLST